MQIAAAQTVWGYTLTVVVDRQIGEEAVPHAFDVHAIAAGVEESEVAHGKPRAVVDLQQMPMLAMIIQGSVLVVIAPCRCS